MRNIKENLNISRINYKSNNLLLEGLIFKPQGQGKFPGVIFLHGHGSSAWDASLIGYFLTRAGFAVFIPSMIGYGLSEGESDFNGPETVKGVIDGVKIFLKEKNVDKNRVGIWGISRGATVAALIVTKEPLLFKAAIFQSGAYEMKSSYETTKIPGIKRVMLEEMGGKNKDQFFVRSPIYQIEKVLCPILILHGAQDERILVQQAKLLDTKLKELKKEHKTIILPKAGHFLTRLTRKKYVFPFLKKYLSKRLPRHFRNGATEHSSL